MRIKSNSIKQLLDDNIIGFDRIKIDNGDGLMSQMPSLSDLMDCEIELIDLKPENNNKTFNKINYNYIKRPVPPTGISKPTPPLVLFIYNQKPKNESKSPNKPQLSKGRLFEEVKRSISPVAYKRSSTRTKYIKNIIV